MSNETVTAAIYADHVKTVNALSTAYKIAIDKATEAFHSGQPYRDLEDAAEAIVNRYAGQVKIFNRCMASQWDRWVRFVQYQRYTDHRNESSQQRESVQPASVAVVCVDAVTTKHQVSSVTYSPDWRITVINRLFDLREELLDASEADGVSYRVSRLLSRMAHVVDTVHAVLTFREPMWVTIWRADGFFRKSHAGK
jgi:hypothetical protein